VARVFISFKTDDTPRVRPIYDSLRAEGMTVFWSNDIPTGSPNYQAIIKAELRKADAVLAVWKRASVDSHAVAQECSQAERDNKLLQLVLDNIDPIDFPMEVRFKSQKAMLIGWTGDKRHPEWSKLITAIRARDTKSSSKALGEEMRALGAKMAEHMDAKTQAPETRTRAIIQPRMIKDLGEHPLLGGKVQVL
jgi:hypothetical protein